MVHLSEAGRVALVIALLAMASVGAAWAYTAYTGPLTDDPPAYVVEEGIFLVTYRTTKWEFETPARTFSQSGQIAFGSILVPIQNVSSVEVILQVSMGGPSVRDEYQVVVRDPVGDSISGSHEVSQPSTEGYLRSDSVITWQRTPQPSAESHHAADRDAALARSAENHTDPSAKGIWSATVELNQPLVGRSGNASLLLRMSQYEAIVLPQTRPTETAPRPTATNTSTPDNSTMANETTTPAPSAPIPPDGMATAPRTAPPTIVSTLRNGHGPFVPEGDSRPYPERSV